MPLVSVIVPVYNPGRQIDECIRSLLSQTLPREELELIFVDDGSTDDTPARLDALAAEHPHVKVEHIPNSGWPGKPRNVGMDMATGEYLFFVDNDDWLEDDALEQLVAMAREDRAEIVIGKVVGHGKRVPRSIFERNLHGVALDNAPELLMLLSPHKLLRRDFVERNGLRFPEGRRRLEDHVFVVAAYFAAERISVLADRPIYHWVRHEEQPGASYEQFNPAGYYGNVREVLDIVEANTEPGPWRDKLLTHWYRGKMLGRVGGRRWRRRDEEWRHAVYEEVRKLALERFDDSIHDRLAFNLKMRSILLRAGDYEGLQRLARFENRIESRVRVRGIERGGTHLVLRLESRLGSERARLRFERHGERTFWVPATDDLKDTIPEEQRDVTGLLRKGTVAVWLRNVEDDSEYVLPARTTVKIDQGASPERRRPRLVTAVPIAPTAAAAGGPLPPGTWEVHAEVSIAGFSWSATVERREEPLLVTTYGPGRIVVGAEAPPPPPLPARVYRRLPAPVMQTFRRTRARAAAVARR
jgi:glycosyltransferase involved in cell wall biosynthesis